MDNGPVKHFSQVQNQYKKEEFDDRMTSDIDEHSGTNLAMKLLIVVAFLASLAMGQENSDGKYTQITCWENENCV